MMIPAFESFWHWASWFSFVAVLAVLLPSFRLFTISKRYQSGSDLHIRD